MASIIFEAPHSDGAVGGVGRKRMGRQAGTKGKQHLSCGRGRGTTRHMGGRTPALVAGLPQPFHPPLPAPLLSFYDKDAPIYTMSRFLPPSKVVDSEVSGAPLEVLSGTATVLFGAATVRLQYRWWYLCWYSYSSSVYGGGLRGKWVAPLELDTAQFGIRWIGAAVAGFSGQTPCTWWPRPPSGSCTPVATWSLKRGDGSFGCPPSSQRALPPLAFVPACCYNLLEIVLFASSSWAGQASNDLQPFVSNLSPRATPLQ